MNDVPQVAGVGMSGDARPSGVDARPATPDPVVRDGCLSLGEAVRFSGLGRTRLYGLMSAGTLPYVQAGTRRLIPRAALQQWLAAHLAPAT